MVVTCGAMEEENFWVNAAPERTANLGVSVRSHKRENTVNTTSGSLFFSTEVSTVSVCWPMAYLRCQGNIYLKAK